MTKVIITMKTGQRKQTSKTKNKVQTKYDIDAQQRGQGRPHALMAWDIKIAKAVGYNYKIYN